MIKKIGFVCMVHFLFVFAHCSKTVEPETEREPEIVLAPEVVELEDSAINGIASIDSAGVITFSQRTPALEDLRAGNIIASGPIAIAPDGFLKRVEKINVSGSSIIVETINATLEETFQKATISLEDSLTADDLAFDKVSLPDGVSMSGGTGDNIKFNIDVILYDSDKNYDTTYDQVRASGNFEFKPAFVFKIEISDYELEELYFEHKTTQITEIALSCGAGISWHIEQSLLPHPIQFPPVTIMAGFIPIVVSPELDIVVGASVAGSIGFCAETGLVRQTTQLYASIHFKDEVWTPSSRYAKEFYFEKPQLGANITARGYAGPQLKFKLYGVAGPYIKANGYLELDADLLSDPWWSLYAGFNLIAGIKVELLGRKVIADWEVADLIKYRQLLVSADTEPADIIAPASVTNLVASDSTSNTVLLTWTAPGDDETVGMAAVYDIRYSTSAINDSNWGGATQCTGEPDPKAAGQSESFSVTGLSCGTTYFFAIKAADEASNWSVLSNVVNKSTATCDGNWSTVGSGLNGNVLALANYNGKLIAGGDFSDAGGTSATHIAAWDGNAWSSLGQGINGRVKALCIYDGKLIAGGAFTTAGGTSANNIAAWNGSDWSRLGSGTSGSVYALTIFNDKLIAVGTFATAGGVDANYIAAWDGSSWSSLGLGLNGCGYDLAVYNNVLIVSGSFTAAGDDDARGIAAWNGSSWASLASGLNDDGYALGVFNSKLIVQGCFTVAGGVAASRIAAWDGASWVPLGLGLSGASYAVDPEFACVLEVFETWLVVAGPFSTAGGLSAEYMACWNGSSWLSIGAGTDGCVYAMTVFDNRLIVGGSFTVAGGIAASYIASWHK